MTQPKEPRIILLNPIWNEVFCLSVMHMNQSVEKPPGVRGPQPPEALIGFGDMRVKSAKSLA